MVVNNLALADPIHLRAAPRCTPRKLRIRRQIHGTRQNRRISGALETRMPAVERPHIRHEARGTHHNRYRETQSDGGLTS